MTIVRCPRCRDEVTVPTGASKQALVRCPLCLEQYRLEAALGGIPPALVVVADEVGAAPAVVADSSDSPHEVATDYGLERGSGADRLFEARPGSSRAAPARPVVSGTPRPRRKEKSMVVEMLKVVVGGAAGLALGLLVLWWGFGQDVGDFGPAVARYAPWIVPAKLHRNTSGNSATSDARPSAQVAGDDAAAVDRGVGDGLRLDARFDDALRQSAPPVATGDETGEPLQGTFGQPVESGPAGLDDGSALGLAIDDPLEVMRPASADIELAPLDDFRTGQQPSDEAEVDSADRSNDEQHPAEKLPANRPPMPDLTDLLPAGPFQFSPADDAAPVAEASPATAEPPADARPLVTPQQLAGAISAADAALARYDALPRDDKAARQQAFTDFYLAGSEMGRVVSRLEPSESDAAESRSCRSAGGTA
jgi:hypothetical protein